MQLCLLLSGGAALAQDGRYLRVGTGPAGETHFPLGGMIASAISAPPGLPSCAHGGACGVPGLIAVTSATSGSVANLEAISAGRLDAGLAEADIGVRATSGQAPFQDHRLDNLRAIANLGSDQLHLVVLRDGPIHALRDLRGKRIALGEDGSGTQFHAKLLLAALGFKPGEVKEQEQRSALAADAMLAGKLDGFFVMDAAPVPSVTELAKARALRLIPISGPAVEKLRRSDPLLVQSRINAGSYYGIGSDTPTLATRLTLVVSASLPDDLVYGMTQALWQPETLLLLNDGGRGGLSIAIGNALTNLGVPLHQAAQRYYAERGKTP